MGDDDDAAAPRRKRPRVGELGRLAEIVMVLSAMGEMRGGRDPSDAERAMAAEAAERLVRVCGGDGIRPKDLFSADAVRVLVEDLGLNRGRDYAAGFRPPPKVSIAEKLTLTKKKMEESKEITAHSSINSSQPLQVGFGALSDNHGSTLHGTPKYLQQSSMPLSSGGFQTVSPLVNVPGHISATSSFKQSQFSEAQPAVASIKASSNSSLLPSPHAETTNLRLDARVNGMHHMTQAVQGNTADYLPNAANSTIQSTSSAVNNLGQAYNLPGHVQVNSDDIYAVNAAQSSHQVVGNPHALNSEVQGAPSNLLIGNQPSQGLTFVHGPSFFTNHGDIAKSVQKILQPKVFDHPDWIPPSSDYTNKPINCQICKIAVMDVESLLVCDNCEKGTHLKCLQSYNNKGIPKAEWHCPRCLMSSNGKPLPPKYGRVTRSSIPAKASSSSAVAHHSSEKKAENPDTKVSQQKIVANGNSGLLHPVHSSSTGSDHSESNPDSKVIGGGETKGFSSTVGGKKCEEIHTLPASHSDIKERDMATTPQIKSESRDIVVKNTGSSAHDMQIHHQKMKLEHSSSEQPHESLVETTNQSQLSSDSKLDKETAVLGVEASTCQLQESSMPITDESKEPLELEASAQCKAVHDIQLEDSGNFQAAQNGKLGTNESIEDSQLKETSEPRASSDNTLDERNNAPATSNGDLTVANRLRDCGQTSPESSIGDWVGNIIETSEQKNFYQSCRVNGVVHKLQDYVLVSSTSHRFPPSKLQTLWEDKKSGSKWASVSSYHFPEEAASQPSTPENDEVYAANNESTIPISSICGPCDVLPEDKFREESTRRALLKDKDSGLHPFFMCRWKYDESNGTFESLTD